MTLKDLAKEYGMNIETLCEKTGYTRQGLNRILRSERVIYPDRFCQALYHILVLSKNIADHEIEAAKKRDEERFILLDKIATDHGIQWKPSQEPFDDSEIAIIQRREERRFIDNNISKLKMRLTRKSDSSEMVWFVDHEKNDIELEPCEMRSHHSRLAIQRLAAYEDTGLTPEEIMNLLNN